MHGTRVYKHNTAGSEDLMGGRVVSKEGVARPQSTEEGGDETAASSDLGQSHSLQLLPYCVSRHSLGKDQHREG